MTISIYCSFCIFDGEEPDWPAPLVYQRSHVLPSMGDDRGGHFHLASIPPWITRDGKCLAGKECSPAAFDEGVCCENYDGHNYWPYLRVTLSSPIPDEDTCVLDRSQVLALRDALSEWLEHTAEDTT